MAELFVCFHKGKLFFKYYTHLQLTIIYNICMIRKICLCRITQNREWCWESQATRSLTCVSISLCTLRAYSMSYDPGNMDFLSSFYLHLQISFLNNRGSRKCLFPSCLIPNSLSHSYGKSKAPNEDTLFIIWTTGINDTEWNQHFKLVISTHS